LRLGKLSVVVFVIWSFACAPPTPAGMAPAGLAPPDLAALEGQVSAHPDDRALGLRLAKAYYAADRFADALPVLQRLLQAQPTDQEARAYLGLTYEGLTQYDSARATYTRLLAAKPAKGVQRLLSGRLALLTRKELQLAARQAIARESLLTRTPPDPTTIAVLPFHYAGADSTYRPLERGLAAIVVTDLSRVRALKLVERARVQALLDELQLVERGSVDPATGARSGRLVGAAQVVQGQLTMGPATQVRMDATVVRAVDVQVAAAGSSEDRLQALFDIEKAVVFQLLDRLGITLTPAERVAISERPTRDLQAFLLYSRGLEAEDRGDFAAAAQAFQGAARLDPGFRAAGDQAATSQDAQTAAAGPATDLATSLSGGAPGVGVPAGLATGTLFTAINGAVPTGANLLQTTGNSAVNGVPPTDPNRICEGAGCAGPGLAGLIGSIIIIIKRP
jgi:tetratricopeptide (TPR) repeat protein